jgi:type II secretory pathway component PulF
MKFAYKATKQDGETHQDVREATDKFDLFRQLRKEGEVVISCNEIKPGVVSAFHTPTFLQGVSAHEKIIFARNLGGMIEAGLAISRALSVLEHQSKKPKLKGIFKQLNTSISQGKTFHQALEEFPSVFNSLFISMVKAGEESGNLAKSLKQVADQLEKNYLIQKKVKGAMIYPGIIISLMIVIGILLLTFVVPRLVDTFKDLNTALPASTQFIIWLSDLFKYHYLLVGITMTVIVMGFYYALQTAGG